MVADARHRLVAEEGEVVAVEQQEHSADRELEAAEEEPVHPRVVVVEARHRPVVVVEGELVHQLGVAGERR